MWEVFEKIITNLEAEVFESSRNMIRTYAFEKAIEIVKQEAEQYNNGWIPCSERLPEKNGMYICTQNSYDLATNKNIIRVSTELVEFYNGKWRRAKNLVVTHWQPLPKPYQPKGE